AWIFGISQSGEPADTLGCIKRMRKRSLQTLALCTVEGSSIPRESDGVLLTHAGPEIGVASTKCYTAQLMALALLAIRLGTLKGTLSSQKAASLFGGLQEIPEKIQSVLYRHDAVARCAEAHHASRDFLFLARGADIATAYEGALKIKEVAYIHATGHAAGEMKHGPIALIDRKMPVVCIAPRTSSYEKMVSNVQEAAARGGQIIAVVNEGDQDLRDHAKHLLVLPETQEALTPLLTVVPLQLLAYYVAIKRGCDVDQPRNLAKSVTVE
ncbi:MAG: SIS domain-containing protein, partial [Elusimicrobia bacterium]|nr:SIS domain-containing protein [Elusimicrobiota bacterium]